MYSDDDDDDDSRESLSAFLHFGVLTRILLFSHCVFVSVFYSRFVKETWLDLEKNNMGASRKKNKYECTHTHTLLFRLEDQCSSECVVVNPVFFFSTCPASGFPVGFCYLNFVTSISIIVSIIIIIITSL